MPSTTLYMEYPLRSTPPLWLPDPPVYNRKLAVHYQHSKNARAPQYFSSFPVESETNSNYGIHFSYDFKTDHTMTRLGDTTIKRGPTSHVSKLAKTTKDYFFHDRVQ